MTHKIRTLIVDDEPLSLHLLELALLEFPDIELVGAAADRLEAERLIRAMAPDLLLLDMRMPGFDGVEFVKALVVETVPTAGFVSAFDNFAVDAFGLEVVGYLHEPIDAEQLGESVARLRCAFGSGDTHLPEVTVIPEQRANAGELPCATASWAIVRNRVARIPTEEISSFEAADDYVIAHAPRRDYLMPDSMRMLETRLSPQLFLRVHRSHFVNTERVAEVIKTKSENVLLRLSNGEVVPVGREYLFQVSKIVDALDRAYSDPFASSSYVRMYGVIMPLRFLLSA